MYFDEVLWQKKRRIQKERWYQMVLWHQSMPSKFQKERRKYYAMMIYEIERPLLSSKVVGDDCWQEKNSKGFKKRLRNCPFNLLVIRGWIILKREGMIRSKKGQIQILT
jgi:hypothetical protein